MNIWMGSSDIFFIQRPREYQRESIFWLANSLFSTFPLIRLMHLQTNKQKSGTELYLNIKMSFAVEQK